MSFNYHNNGLYQVVKTEDGTYKITQKKLSNDIYRKAISTLPDLDNTSAGPKLRQEREKYFKELTKEHFD